ncbi:MAG TPA: S41 family peptidase [Luteolibacter sp.]
MRPIACWLLLTCAATAATPPDSEEAAYPAIERFVEVLETVRKRHPDADKLAYDRLVNHALEGMLSSLDPHSSFIHPEMAAAMKTGELDPHVPSLGFTVGLRDDGPYLSAVDTHGPAANAGLLAGSAILKIDDATPDALPFPDLLKRLDRPPGETTRLTVKSPDAPKPKEIPLTHVVVETRSLADARLLEPGKTTGYVRLAKFGAGCAREMEAALDELEDQGMKSLVLDLRGNPGGQLDETVRILGLFLPPNTAVVTTRGRDGEMGEPMRTPDRQRRKREYPMAVLIDRMSASAAELTPGALQDLKRAKIVGETSYGKGSVQNIIPMGGGTALRLTIATYHTPSGRTPHGTGITPDVAVPVSGDDRANFELLRRRDSLTPDEAKKLADWKDPTLSAALTTLGTP